MGVARRSKRRAHLERDYRLPLRLPLGLLEAAWERSCDFLALAYDALLFPLVFLVAPGTNWTEIRSGSRDPNLLAPPPPGSLLKDQAQFLFQEQQRAAEHTDQTFDSCSR